jgi:hypothetical protein
LCDNRTSKPRFLSACHAVGEVPHGLFYYIQKKKGIVPVPKDILEKYKDEKIVWERPFFYPQINKKINECCRLKFENNFNEKLPEEEKESIEKKVRVVSTITFSLDKA